MISSAVIAMVGCNTLKQVATGACTGAHVRELVERDGSGSQGSAAREAEELALVKAEAKDVSASCGSLRVEQFASTVADIRTLVDTSLVPEGTTNEVRRKHRPAMVAAVADTVQRGLAQASGGASDPRGALAHGARVLAQSPSKVRKLVILSDGIQTVAPVNLATPDLTPATAPRFADALGTVAGLSSIDVVIAGVGRVAGPPPPTSYVDALLAIWTRVCTESHAKTCTVVDTLAIPTAPNTGGQG